MLNWFRKGGSAEVGLDLGSSCWRRVSARGLEQQCASAVLWDLSGNQAVAVGDGAAALVGRHPGHFSLVRPIRQGLLADFDAAEHLGRHLLEEVRGRFHVLASAPAQAKGVELQVLSELLRDLGATSVCLVPSSVCVALAGKRSLLEEPAVAVLDLGLELMQISVYSRGTAIQHAQLVGGARRLQRQLYDHCLRRHWLALGQSQLDQLLPRLKVGGDKEHWLELRGKDLPSGLPRTFMLAAWEVAEWVDEAVQSVHQLVGQMLEETPPSLLQPLLQQGLLLAGGFSQLDGLAESIEQQFSLPVLALEQPEQAVARGLACLIQDSKGLESLLQSQALAGHV